MKSFNAALAYKRGEPHLAEHLVNRPQNEMDGLETLEERLLKARQRGRPGQISSILKSAREMRKLG